MLFRSNDSPVPALLDVPPDADEQRALTLALRSGARGPWAFPAPAGCRSLEEWAADGERRWRRIIALIARAQPTAATSAMLVRT